MSDQVLVLPTDAQRLRLERFGWRRWGPTPQWWVSAEGVTTHWALALLHVTNQMAEWIGEAYDRQAPYFGPDPNQSLLLAVAGDVLAQLDGIASA